MGSNYYKKTYTCECGCNYGSCGKTSMFLLEFYRGSDIYTLYHKKHIDDKNSKLQYLLSFEDFDLDALLEILTSKTNEDLTEQDYKEIKESRGR